MGGRLKNHLIERCCEWGNATRAIVGSRHGCAPAMPTWPEFLQFFATRNQFEDLGVLLDGRYGFDALAEKKINKLQREA
jgi:hypothetical protein